jgi:uncharacterized protein YkwD
MAQQRATGHESRLSAAIVARLNRIRLAHALRPLSLSSSVSQAASQHTEEMGNMGYFAHASADHSAFWLRIRRWYPKSGVRFWSVGENLLWRSPNVTAAQAMRMWMASPEHRSNISIRAGVSSVSPSSISRPRPGPTRIGR